MSRTDKPFILPPPLVRVSPNTYCWRCPRCKKQNSDGDTTCLHCGQDVELREDGP